MSEEELKAIDKENKAINFYKNFIKDKEKELEWMIDQDEEYYKDEIEQSELLIQGFKTILSLIEKKQKEIENLRIKNGKEFVRGVETNEKSWQVKIKDKIETIKNETWYVDGSAEARQACIDELMSLQEE